MVGLSQSLVSEDYRCIKNFDFLVTTIVKNGGDNGNGGGSLTNGSVISIGRNLIIGVMVVGTYIGAGGSLSAVTEVFIKFSEKKIVLSEKIDV